MKQRILLLLLLITAIAMCNRLNAQPAFLQKVPENARKYTLSIEPFSALYNGGLRTGFEMRVNNTHQWLQAIPIIYYHPYSKDDYYDHNVMATIYNDSHTRLHGLKGAGLELGYKLFLKTPEVFYCKAGLSYTHLNASYSALQLSEFIEDGLHYHFYERKNLRQTFNNVAINASIGVQSTVRRFAFFVGGYIGVAYHISFYDDRLLQHNTRYDFGYTGFSCIFGFRAGWAFGKTKDLDNTRRVAMN